MAHFLGGRWVPRDPGGGPTSLHDFDLVSSSGRRYAVEVTRFTDPALLAVLDATQQRDWGVEGLRANWVVKLRGAPNVSVLHRELPPLILALERSGLSSHVFDRDDDSLSPPLAALRDLAVALVYRLDDVDDGDGEIVIGQASQVGATSVDLLVTIAEDLSNQADNLDKLAKAHADERHLFIWAEHERRETVAAMGWGAFPNRAPVLPPRTDGVWFATASTPSRVNTFHKATGWVDLGSYFGIEPEG